MLDPYNMNTAGSKEPLRDNQPARDNIQANIPILAQKHCESGGCGKVAIVIQKSDLEGGKPQPPVIVVYDCDKKIFTDEQRPNTDFDDPISGWRF